MRDAAKLCPVSRTGTSFTVVTLPFPFLSVYIYPLKDIFLPRQSLVKNVGTSIFNHIKKEENQNKITINVKKNRSFITKVISTYFLLTLYRLINNVD